MTEPILTIEQDTDSLNPITDFDHLGSMVCWHRRDVYGHIQPKKSPDEWRKANVPEGSVELPLFLLDHSGTTIRTVPFNDPWDSGQLGFIFATPEKICKEYSCKKITPAIIKKVKEVLIAEVHLYDLWMTGQAWGYVFKKPLPACKECGHVAWEEPESCWGFYGETLEETGLQHEVPEAAKPLLEEAWETRRLS